MSANSEFDDSLLMSAMELAAESGWSSFNPVTLSRRVDIDLARILEKFASREDLLKRFSRYLDRKMVQLPDPGTEDLTIRERLFELIMERLDAMASFRPALQALAKSRRLEPGLSLQAVCNIDRSSGWMLAAAGVDMGGPEGRVRRLLLGQAYARVLRVWLDDETADLGPTMAELDKRLAQLEDFANGWERVRGIAKPQRNAGGSHQDRQPPFEHEINPI